MASRLRQPQSVTDKNASILKVDISTQLQDSDIPRNSFENLKTRSAPIAKLPHIHVGQVGLWAYSYVSDVQEYTGAWALIFLASKVQILMPGQTNKLP